MSPFVHGDYTASVSEPLAYLLTWTCYGSWLHGDERGSVDDRHNIFQTPFVGPDQARQTRSVGRLLRAPVVLDTKARRIVEQTLAEHCRHRGWELLASAVRTNHVHIVVAAVDAPPERVLGQLKAWTTRRLREAGIISAQAKAWTHHGSTRYLWKEHSVHAAVEYVLEGQGKHVT